MTLKILRVVNESQDFDDFALNAIDEKMAGLMHDARAGYAIPAVVEMVGANLIVEFRPRPHAEAMRVGFYIAESL